MSTEPALVFATTSEPPPLEIRVNFGVFAGRAATAAELDELARTLVPEVGDVSIVAEERLEVGEEAEASLHQVRVDVAAEQLPASDAEIRALTGRLVAAAERWARACISDRHAEVSEL